LTEVAPRPLKVFLCHASQDKPAVRELCQRLKTEGWIDPWLDEEKLSLGQYWTTAIEEALDAADIVLIFLSRHSVNKEGFVQRELNYAWELSLEKPRSVIFLIPFRLDECEVPRYLRSRQWGDYFGKKQDKTYEILLQSLKLRHEQKLQVEAQVQAQIDEQALVQKEVEDKVRRERQEVFRQQTEARIRKEMEEAERVGRVSNPTPPAQPKVSQVTNLTNNNKLVLSNGMEFMRVPAGKFLMGSRDDNPMADDDEKPQHTVNRPYDFYMARFPVTNELYNAYVTAKRAKHPVSDWEKKKDHPVVYVKWQEALAYCQWLHNLLKGELPKNMILRLPTEAEWEKAARGEKGNEWPWGDEFDKNKCNSIEGGKGTTTSVRLYSPQGDSSFGCADMSGNVWEWTHSMKKAYPYDAKDGREAEKALGSHVIRGGSYNGNKEYARCAFRYDANNLFDADYNLGFRLCVSPISPEGSWFVVF
jgi:formylglycine-generating enzyme required for sulfatase activity